MLDCNVILHLSVFVFGPVFAVQFVNDLHCKKTDLLALRVHHSAMLKILSTSVFVPIVCARICRKVYFLRRTAVLILRPAIEFCPAGEAVKELFADPMLKAGVGLKPKPPPAGGFNAGMAGLAAGAADPPPKLNTLLLVADAPKPPVLPNWKPPCPVEAAVDPNVGAALAC